MKRVSLLLLFLLALGGCKTNDSTSNDTPAPVINSIVPAVILRGQTIDGQILGANFNGVGVVQLGDGINLIGITGVAENAINVRFFVRSDAQPGPRTVSVTTASGTATTSTMLSVGGNRAPVAQFTVDPDVGVSQTVFSFDASGSSDEDGTVSGYSWDFADGQTAGGKKVTHKFNTAGKFNVKLTVTDNDQGQTLASRELEVKNGKLPVAHFNVSPNEGDTQTLFRFDGSPSIDADGRIVAWDWFFGDGGRKKGKIVEHRFRSTGKHDVKLVVTDNDRLESELKKKIKIRGSVPVASFVVSPEVGNVSTNFRFDGSSSSDRDGSIASYSWNFGDGTSGSGSIVMHTFPRADTFRIQLDVMDRDGLRGSTSRNFRVFQGDDPGPGPGPDPGPGGSCAPRAPNQNVPYRAIVESFTESPRVVTVKFVEDYGCAPFYRCGDVRWGGLAGWSDTDAEKWVGVMCKFEDLGGGRARITLAPNIGTYSPEPGNKVYTWPQRDCSISQCNGVN
ncbi:PKD domain-containing protein [bacterium]|nr:PKD domain-containing protein [bacterium]